MIAKYQNASLIKVVKPIYKIHLVGKGFILRADMAMED